MLWKYHSRVSQSEMLHWCICLFSLHSACCPLSTRWHEDKLLLSTCEKVFKRETEPKVLLIAALELAVVGVCKKIKNPFYHFWFIQISFHTAAKNLSYLQISCISNLTNLAEKAVNINITVWEISLNTLSVQRFAKCDAKQKEFKQWNIKGIDKYFWSGLVGGTHA